jgi:hypothetical protein
LMSARTEDVVAASISAAQSAREVGSFIVSFS